MHEEDKLSHALLLLRGGGVVERNLFLDSREYERALSEMIWLGSAMRTFPSSQ